MVPFRVTITQDAERQLQSLGARAERILEAAILSKLLFLPTTPTHAIKRLRSNPFAGYELRTGDLRVLYNVVGDEVVILLVGRKIENKLIVEGEEFHEHQDHPIERTGIGSETDADRMRDVG